ncbi:hypothetical protein H2200_012513 [Cladophialophora chaetospira]|uniref:Uncharacterized protein n=1 Tax=Cladophialophora chaetospira TaxID=386627 RepID=A0AA38WY17_9EURO|nr:hypothetical protein H2200_012513 [Cladophialophora chaetospira]
MCYHTTYLFLACGHAALGNPIPDSHCLRQDAQTIRRHSEHEDRQQQQPSQTEGNSLPSPPTTPQPPTECREKLMHPLHTFRLKTLCPSCQEERDARIEAFDAHTREDVEQRILTRSAERNERGSDFGRRRLFRASTKLEMIMDAPGTSSQSGKTWDTLSQAGSLQSPVGEGVGKIMDGFRRRWNNHDTASSPGESRRDSGEQSAPPYSPSVARLSFAVLGDGQDRL